MRPRDPDGDIAARLVDWGDGAQGGLRHRYADDGTYTVTRHRRRRGRPHRRPATAQVVVTSSAPEVAVTPTTLVAGEAGLVGFTVVDLAEARPAAEPSRLTSDPAGLAPTDPYTADGRQPRLQGDPARGRVVHRHR